MIEVEPFSPAYFQLVRELPFLGAYFALGDRVLVAGEGVAVKVAPAGRAAWTPDDLGRVLRGLRGRAGDAHLQPGGRAFLDWSEVYREHYGSLVRFLYRRTGDQARAEDLAQEAFVRALEHRPDRPRAWLFTVALNLARDEGRHESVRRRHLRLLKGEAEGATGEPPPDVTVERRETIERVRAALTRLGERDRDALLLREEGFSYDEIADQLGLSPGSIGTTLARARARLVEAYERLERKRDDRDVAR